MKWCMDKLKYINKHKRGEIIMKTKKIISLIAVSILICGVIGGCGRKENTTVKKNDIAMESIQPEEGHIFAIAENSIVPKFVTSRYSNYSNLVQEYLTATRLFRDDTMNQAFIDKYGYQKVIDKGTYTSKDIQEVNPEYYAGLSSFLYMKNIDGFQRASIEKGYLLQIQNYLQDTLLDEKSTGYTLADDFSVLKPKEVVQDYLKENKIKITNIEYPNDFECADSTGTGTVMITVNVPIKGTKDSKAFEETEKYDFHFVLSKDLRDGADFDLKNLDKGEIMAVTNSFYVQTIPGYDYKKIEETYKKMLDK